jgi:hypothetical protein
MVQRRNGATAQRQKGVMESLGINKPVPLLALLRRSGYAKARERLTLPAEALAIAGGGFARTKSPSVDAYLQSIL